MALTVVAITVPGLTGGRYMTWQAWRKITAPTVALTIAAKRTLLTNGAGSFSADPDYVWYIVEPGATGRYVRVPAPPSAKYSQLVDVDPVTLGPAVTLASVAATMRAQSDRIDALTASLASLITVSQSGNLVLNMGS